MKKIYSHVFLLTIAFLILSPLIWVFLASFTEKAQASFLIERIFAPESLSSDIKSNKLTVKYKMRDVSGIKPGRESRLNYKLKGENAGLTGLVSINPETGALKCEVLADVDTTTLAPEEWLFTFAMDDEGKVGACPALKNETLAAAFEKFEVSGKDKTVKAVVKTKPSVQTGFPGMQEFTFGTEFAGKFAVITINSYDNKLEYQSEDTAFDPAANPDVRWLMHFPIKADGNIDSTKVKVNRRSLLTFLNVLTLENYRDILSDSSFRIWLTNSLVVSLGTALIAVIFGFIAGYAFSRYKFPGKHTAMLWVLTTQLFPLAMMIVPFYILAARVFPSLIPGFQLVNSLVGLTLIYSATALPFAIWMIKGYFDTIPIDMEEAAAIDGASLGQTLTLILLPLTRPAMFTAFLFAFVQAWNEYAIASLFMSDPNKITLPVGLKALLDNNNVAGFASAAVIVSIPIVILFLSMKRELVEGATLGAVKG